MAVALIAAALRLALVLAPPAETFPEGRVVEGGVVVEEGRRPATEELLRGSAAKDMLEGTVLPRLQDYQVQSFWGGTLVVSVLAVPLFAAFGPTLAALRTTTVLFAALAAAATFAILDRIAGRRAAWIGGLLMACAPPGLSIFGSMAYGAEAESQTLSLLVLWAFLAWARGGRRPALAFLGGCLAGFAIYCGYVVVPLLALLCAYACWIEPGILRTRSAAWALAGALVGSWPWTYFNLTHSGAGLELYGRTLVEHLAPGGVRQLVASTVDLVARDLPASFYLPEPWRLPLGRAVLALCAALAVVAAFRHRASLVRALHPPWRPAGEPRTLERVHPAVLLLLFPPVYALAYVLTDFRVDHDLGRAFGYRYMLPFFPFLLMLAALGLDALAQRSRRLRHASSAVAALLCALFLTADLAACRLDLARRSLTMRGYSDVHFARSIVLRWVDDPDTLSHVAEAVARKRSPAQQEKFFFVVAQNAKFFLHPTTVVTEYDGRATPDWAAALAHLAAIAPEPYAAFFEPLLPGERIFLHHEIDLWREAHGIRPPEHVATSRD